MQRLPLLARNITKMKIAVLTLAYREASFIGAVIKNWHGKAAHHLVLASKKPWHGMELPEDGMVEIARKMGAEVIELEWPSETVQRNFGLGRLYDYDYVLTVDADELYTEEDQLKLLEWLGSSGDEEYADNFNAYKVMNVATYFKTMDYRLDPPDRHHPSIAVNPKKITYREHRCPSQEYEIALPITMHHISYLRQDLRLFHKFKQFEHYDQVKADWYQNVWKKWTPETEDVRAYGSEKSKAVRNPLPEELQKLLYGVQ